MAGGGQVIVQVAKNKMVFEKILQKLKGEKNDLEYPNRFLKFYHHNQERLLKERKLSYHDKKKKGICVRCSRTALEGIVFCAYHQQRQVSYNKQARQK